MDTNLWHDFPEMRGRGGQRPFGTFPKIHPFWWRHLSLRVQFEHTLDVILHRIWQQVYRNADKNQTGMHIWSSPILANLLQGRHSQGYVSADCGKTIVADLWLPVKQKGPCGYTEGTQQISLAQVFFIERNIFSSTLFIGSPNWSKVSVITSLEFQSSVCFVTHRMVISLSSCRRSMTTDNWLWAL